MSTRSSSRARRSLIEDQVILSNSDTKTKVNVALAKLGGADVMWRIWPAVMLHTVFAALIVVISEYTTVRLEIPNIMLTLLGVVIGFVISLRVSSGYDRYWWGRCAWSDLVKNSRTISRLIWIHVPPRMGTVQVANTGHSDSSSTSDHASLEEIGQVMREKRMMMGLIEAFAVALKHYVRGELGIYYQDMYSIVRPFHERKSHLEHGREHPHAAPAGLPNNGESSTVQHQSNAEVLTANSSHTCLSATTGRQEMTDVISGGTSVPSYGAVMINESRFLAPTHQSLRHASSDASLASSSSDLSIREPLLPAKLSTPNASPSPDLMPFGPLVMKLGHIINPYTWYVVLRTTLRRQNAGGDEESGGENRHCEQGGSGHSRAYTREHRRRAARQVHRVRGKHQPRLGGDGDNLPLEIIRCMSEWLCVLESRQVVSGSAIGGIHGCLTVYEDILGTLERILTTPLPYVYSQHIRHTVWLYLFFLPFQLAEEFHWYTIPGVAVAAFFYLGFLAAGDELEQPFGYDEDDLDLDLFCREIIKADLRMLMTTPCPNAPTGSQQSESPLDITETRTVVELCVENSIKKGKHVNSRHEHAAVCVA